MTNRCKYCSGYLHFSHIDSKKRNVYRCTRCVAVDDRFYLLEPFLVEIKVERRANNEYDSVLVIKQGD